MDDRYLKKQRLSQALGHNRSAILGAYIGSINTNEVTTNNDRCRRNIMGNLPSIDSKSLDVINPAWHEDIAKIQLTMNELEVHLTLQQIQFLWSNYSRRHGVIWMKPNLEIALAIEVSILSTKKS